MVERMVPTVQLIPSLQTQLQVSVLYALICLLLVSCAHVTPVMDFCGDVIGRKSQSFRNQRGNSQVAAIVRTTSLHVCCCSRESGHCQEAACVVPTGPKHAVGSRAAGGDSSAPIDVGLVCRVVWGIVPIVFVVVLIVMKSAKCVTRPVSGRLKDYNVQYQQQQLLPQVDQSEGSAA